MTFRWQYQSFARTPEPPADDGAAQPYGQQPGPIFTAVAVAVISTAWVGDVHSAGGDEHQPFMQASEPVRLPPPVLQGWWAGDLSGNVAEAGPDSDGTQLSYERQSIPGPLPLLTEGWWAGDLNSGAGVVDDGSAQSFLQFPDPVRLLPIFTEWWWSGDLASGVIPPIPTTTIIGLGRFKRNATVENWRQFILDPPFSDDFVIDASGDVDLVYPAGTFPSTTVSSDYTATASDVVIYVNAIDGPILITLLAISALSNKFYHIKKIDSSANLVTVDPNGVETIDLGPEAVLASPQECITIHPALSNWNVI